MPKQIEIQCTEEMAPLIVEAVSWFVASHYPQAADECSAAAREALLDLVARFERELVPTGRSAYSSRVRAFVCEAIKGYRSQLEQRSGESWEYRAASLTAACRGESDGSDYAPAVAADLAVRRQDP